MDELIQALLIFSKYTKAEYPTGCEHDEFRVYVDPADVSEKDLNRLEEYGFDKDPDLLDCFISYKYGSA